MKDSRIHVNEMIVKYKPEVFSFFRFSTKIYILRIKNIAPPATQIHAAFCIR